MSKETQHLIRTGLILVSTAAVSAVWLFVDLSPEQTGGVMGALAVLAPAALDALRVQAGK